MVERQGTISVNVFLKVKQYEDMKKLAFQRKSSLSNIIREGIDVILKKDKIKK